MGKHPDHCPGYNGSLDQLAQEIDNMTHEAKARLFQRLYELGAKRDREELALGHEQYYLRLSALVTPGLKIVAQGERNCWEICKKHTEIETR